MRKAIPILLALATLGAAGCDDTTTTPRDVTPPAAPRGLFSVTVDGTASLHWLANTEGDLAGYRVYQAPCASGASCPYDRVGSTSGVDFVVTGLTNGVTRYFAVSAVDQAGNESPLSVQDVLDTPRPAGHAVLGNFLNSSTGAGWDFSAFSPRSSNNNETDMFYGNNSDPGTNNGVAQMFATSHIVQTSPDTVFINNEIQDAGFASSLDAVDFSPVGQDKGWSPTGTVELISGHNYIVWTWDDHYAKFRVVGADATIVGLDWAYQTATGNPELRARPVHTTTTTRRAVSWKR